MHDHVTKLSHAARAVLLIGLLGLTVLLLSPAHRTPVLRWTFNGAFLLQLGSAVWRAHRHRLVKQGPEDRVRSVLASWPWLASGRFERAVLGAAGFVFLLLARS